VRYLSSEMGETEFVERISDFQDIPYDDWAAIDVKEVSHGFQDYILPNDITIIDYLEINDSFYLIGEEIRMIYDKLDKGIAIIGIQKDPKSDLGRGGTFSLEKARLYVTLTSNPPEGGIAKIEKCKNRVNKLVGMKGKECVFRIRYGNEIRQITKWDYWEKK